MQKAKFEIRDILPIALTLVVVGIGTAYGLSVLSDLKTDFKNDNLGTLTCNSTSGVYTGCGAAYNATDDAIRGVGKLPEKLPLIATVIVAVIIIGILVRYLMVQI